MYLIVQKSNQHSGKIAEAIYLEVSKKAELWFSISRMLKFLNVSCSEYLARLHHLPSDIEKRRKAIKTIKQDISKNSIPNYGVPKVTVKLRKTGEVIPEKSVGTYMRQMGSHAQWSDP